MKTAFKIASILTAGLTSANAAVLAHYGLNNNDANDIITPNLTASDLSASVGGYSSLAPIEGSHYRFIQSNDIAAGPVTTANILSSIMLQASAGNQIELDATDSITMRAVAFSTADGTQTPYEVNMRLFVASDSGFTNILASSAEFDVNVTPETGVSNFGAIVDINLDSAVTSSGPIFIGIAFTDNSDHTPTNRNIRYDDITINGNIEAIPEPSSTALFGLGGLALILRRRK